MTPTDRPRFVPVNPKTGDIVLAGNWSVTDERRDLDEHGEPRTTITIVEHAGDDQ